eukprot:3674457-Prymnesium_polylepis.1
MSHCAIDQLRGTRNTDHADATAVAGLGTAICDPDLVQRAGAVRSAHTHTVDYVGRRPAALYRDPCQRAHAVVQMDCSCVSSAR